MKCARILLFSTLAFAAPAWGQSPPLLMDFSRVQHKPGEVTTPENQKVPAGTVELVDGRFGKACKFSFVASTGPQLFTAWVNPAEDWDQYEGFSFWVQGDASTSCGGLEFIDGNDYALRFGYCFPIDSTDWVKISVPWIDLDYTRLPRYATQNREKPDYLDARQITLIVFVLDQPAGSMPVTLFFDNVRLAREATGKVEMRRR